MANVKKKIAKVKDRINQLEEEMLHQLTKKNSHTPEISISEYQRRIMTAKQELIALTK